MLITKIYIYRVNLHFDKQTHSPTHQQYTNRKAYHKICIKIPRVNFFYHHRQRAKACFPKLEGSLETGKTRLRPLHGKYPPPPCAYVSHSVFVNRCSHLLFTCSLLLLTVHQNTQLGCKEISGTENMVLTNIQQRFPPLLSAGPSTQQSIFTRLS